MNLNDRINLAKSKEMNNLITIDRQIRNSQTQRANIAPKLMTRIENQIVEAYKKPIAFEEQYVDENGDTKVRYKKYLDATIKPELDPLPFPNVENSNIDKFFYDKFVIKNENTVKHIKFCEEEIKQLDTVGKQDIKEQYDSEMEAMLVRYHDPPTIARLTDVYKRRYQDNLLKNNNAINSLRNEIENAYTSINNVNHIHAGERAYVSNLKKENDRIKKKIKQK